VSVAEKEFEFPPGAFWRVGAVDDVRRKVGPGRIVFPDSETGFARFFDRAGTLQAESHLQAADHVLDQQFEKRLVPVDGIKFFH